MRLSHILLLGFAILLGACSNLGGAVGSAAQAYWNSRNPPSFAQTPLQPQFTYLEVVGPASSALMVLANADKPVQQADRPVETWVSSSGEVLRTQSGFVVGSTGVPYLPEVAQTSWGNADDPVGPMQLEFNMANAGLSKVPMLWQSVGVPAQLLSKPGPLLQRAQKVNGLQYKAWLASTESKEGTTPRLNAYGQVFQLVATDPTTGNLVYGQYCVGGLQGRCISYLLRTAARNL